MVSKTSDGWEIYCGYRIRNLFLGYKIEQMW